MIWYFEAVADYVLVVPNISENQVNVRIISWFNLEYWKG